MNNSGRFQPGHVMSEETKAKISQTLKGVNTWQKGRKHSEETKAKMSAAKKGKTPTWAVRSGEDHHNWKGGITPESEAQRVRFKITIRLEVLERDNYTCALCDSGVDLQVDHIQSWADYPEERFDIDNCRTLCTKCHYKLTYGRDMPETTKNWGHNVPRRVQS